MKLKTKFNKLSPAQRLYGLDKPIIAITGGIATGKSTVSESLNAKGYQVIDADKLVKAIYNTTQAKEFIRENVPEAYYEEGINFKRLRELFFSSEEIKKLIETFIYPNLKAAFLKEASGSSNQEFYIYDVPLLFERGLDSKVDLIIVVYAPKHIQIKRLIERDHCSLDTAEKILLEQMDIEQKVLKADFVIKNMSSKNDVAVEVDKLLLHVLN